MDCREVDVAIVGAGPAGSALAIALAGQGRKVVLLEKSILPRHKICGDFLTPGSVKRLARLGAPGLSEAGPAVLRGMRLTYEATDVLSSFPEQSPGWGLSRLRLDAPMARASAAAGAQLVEQMRVDRFGPADPDGPWVEGIHPDGARRRWIAKLVVEAGGRHGLIGRRLGWRQDDPRLERYALWSHMEKVGGLGPRAEMHVFEGGYVGVAPSEAAAGSDRANVTMVLAPRLWRRARRDPRGFFLEQLRRHPELSARCRDARWTTPLRGLGPLACRARRVAGRGIAMVGDAGGFIDPFTGEGVSIALASADLLAGSIACHGLEGPGALEAYQAAHRAAFTAKLRLARLLQMVIAHPWMARAMARALASRRDLADRMVGATGDLLPARQVLNASYVGRLLLASLSAAGG